MLCFECGCGRMGVDHGSLYCLACGTVVEETVFV